MPAGTGRIMFVSWTFSLGVGMRPNLAGSDERGHLSIARRVDRLIYESVIVTYIIPVSSFMVTYHIHNHPSSFDSSYFPHSDIYPR